MYSIKSEVPASWRQINLDGEMELNECERRQLVGVRWATATAACQVEGGVREGGRTESIWDVFSQRSGAIYRGESAAHACGFYEGHWKAALERLQWLGVSDYRFSVSWSRIVPSATGEINEEGVAYYVGIVDDLVASGIHPIVTLYHWDLPQWLQDEGGWLAKRAVAEYCRYVETICSALAGRGISWITLNEPFCSAFHGYYTGIHAPGFRHDESWLDVAIVLLDAHLGGVRTIRRLDPSSTVGIAINLSDVCVDSNEDQEAGRIVDLVENRLFMDPLLRGVFPSDAPVFFGDERWQAAVARLSHPIADNGMDFIGVNYYEQHIVATAQGEEAEIGNAVKKKRLGLRSANGVAVAPDGLRRVLERVSHCTTLPIWITEIGIGLHDYLDDNQKCHDFERIYFYRENIREIAHLRDSGIDVRGVVFWTLQDNFEWSEGYSLNYGLFYTDFATRMCIPKSSAIWVRDFISSINSASSN